MATVNEIKERMQSIRDTQKITNAMYLTSSSQLRAARQRVDSNKIYFQTVRELMNDILTHMPDLEHPYLDSEGIEGVDEPKQPVCGYVVITADKGMTGSYNHDVLNFAVNRLKQNELAKLFVIGEAGRQHFMREGIRIDYSFLYSAQNPSVYRARQIAEYLLAQFDSGAINEIRVIYTKMINSTATEPEEVRILPLKRDMFKTEQTNDTEEITLWPTPEATIEHIVPDFLMGFIYGALMESYSSELHARMQAMDKANQAASDMLVSLTTSYNRARQGLITQQITEIFGGAKALKKNKANE